MNEQVQIELKKILHDRISTSESTRTTYARKEKNTYAPLVAHKWS